MLPKSVLPLLLRLSQISPTSSNVDRREKSIVAKMRGANHPALPAYVAFQKSRSHLAYGGFLGKQYDPFLANQAAKLPDNPWLVDFDLRKLHPLCCNFGMGSPDMFYTGRRSLGKTPEEREAVPAAHADEHGAPVLSALGELRPSRIMSTVADWLARLNPAP